MYKLTKNNIVMLITEEKVTSIPMDESNLDYQTYLKWLDGYELQITGPMKMEWVKVAESNTPLPADEEL